jgi:lysophospholipase L1-like esterase
MHEIIGKDKEYKYSWPTDGHYNAKGYKVMGEIIYRKAAPYIAERDTAKKLPR